MDKKEAEARLMGTIFLVFIIIIIGRVTFTL